MEYVFNGVRHKLKCTNHCENRESKSVLVICDRGKL